MRQEGTALKPSVDLGLAIAECHARRGVPMSTRQIADFCGCCHGNIQLIEQRALRKARLRAKELSAHLIS